MPHFPQPHRFSRRHLLQMGGLAATLSTMAPFANAHDKHSAPGKVASHVATPPTVKRDTTFPLQFRSDGRFRIVQFNDTQDDHLTDHRTIDFMGMVLDREKPDFALINGDVITDGPKNPKQVYQAINNVVMPMESREIPWAITFGNHDEDSVEDAGTGVYEKQMADFVRQYHFNLNPPAGDRPYGHSDTRLLIKASDSDTARFAVWLLDSGNYLPEGTKGDNDESIPDYDYIRPGQIEWYTKLSVEDEKQFGHLVPGLMYFHIPTYEHRDVWFGGPAHTTNTQHNKAVGAYGITGVKNEDVYYGAFNSGIYAAVRERGDIRGIYCGHDHINSYTGNYYGLELGYCPGTGFGPYGLKDGTWKMHTLRGARIFDLDEKSKKIYTDTRVVFAKDLGLDMNPKKQPLKEPKPLPEYVRIPG